MNLVKTSFFLLECLGGFFYTLFILKLNPGQSRIMTLSALDSNKEHFREALNHYESILTILDYFELELPYDAYESFPENWAEDPLLLFGQYLEILES